MTYFLKFTDEAEAQAALEAAGIYVPPAGDNEGFYRKADIGWAFDPIGTIIEGGSWDIETGEELVPPTIIEGWHANYAGDSLPSELEPYIVTPVSPYRVFAS